MCTILAIIGALVVLKIAFVVLFPATAMQLRVKQLTRAADRVMQARLHQLEEQARRDEKGQG